MEKSEGSSPPPLQMPDVMARLYQVRGRLLERCDDSEDAQYRELYGYLSRVSISGDARFAYFVSRREAGDTRSYEDRKEPLTPEFLDVVVGQAEALVAARPPKH